MISTRRNVNKNVVNAKLELLNIKEESEKSNKDENCAQQSILTTPI